MSIGDPIVVTGMGVVSPLGIGVEANWRNLVLGRSGIVFNTRFDVSDYGCKIAGLVPSREDDADGFDPLDYLGSKGLKKTDLFIQYALAATQEALLQADWVPGTEEERQGTATIIATGVGGFLSMMQAADTLREKGPRRLSPFIVPSFLANLAAGQVSIRYGFKGPIGAPVTACAASLQAIGDGMRMLRTGEAEIAICGGADACIHPVAVAGFGAARALSTGYNDRPAEASRPFDKGHDGFVLSEGAATIVIETLSHAERRGARPLARLTGYGTSADAYHVTAGCPDGSGARMAMDRALRMAGVGPADIDYINAHSTSTPVGDAAEMAAIGAVFPERGKDLLISSTKSATGHLLGAAGAIEAIFSVKALQDGIVPPGLNIADPEPEADRFDLVPDEAKEKPLSHVLSNGFGFGGVNASLVLSRMS